MFKEGDVLVNKDDKTDELTIKGIGLNEQDQPSYETTRGSRLQSQVDAQYVLLVNQTLTGGKSRRRKRKRRTNRRRRRSRRN
jgi:hypothetical protein